MPEERAARWPSREGGRPDWMPFAFLVYLGFLFVQPALDRAGFTEWAVTLGSIAIFLPLYFLCYRLDGKNALWPAAGIMVLGFVVSPFNGGASVYLVYAA